LASPSIRFNVSGVISEVVCRRYEFGYLFVFLVGFHDRVRMICGKKEPSGGRVIVSIVCILVFLASPLSPPLPQVYVVGLDGDCGHVSEDEPVALRDVLFIAEDFHVSSDEAVGDASAAVYVGSFHDDCVLDLGVADGCVVADACVGADTGCWSRWCSDRL